MEFLGSFTLGETIYSKITWTPAPGEGATTGSNVTLTHDASGESIGPQEALAAGTNVWTAFVTPDKQGAWTVIWLSEPSGGIFKGRIYVS